MCGIVGLAGESSKKNDDVFTTLLILDQLRGIDSTGVAVVTRVPYDVRIAKNVGNAFDLMETKAFTRTMGVQSRVIIGHNRSATSGTIIRSNAHPFENNSIVGVHNGTLHSKWMLEDAKDFTVDSENLYHHIDKKGLKDCLNNLAGAWSLVWWDKLTEELNFLRNKERPMFITWSHDYKSMYWASEKWMLQVALSRHGVAHTDIMETEVDTLYTYSVNKEGVVSKPHVSAAPSTYRGFQNNQTGGYWAGGKWHEFQKQQQQSSQQKGTQGATQTPNNQEKSRAIAGVTDTDRNIKLEVLARASDPFGGNYYVCYNPLDPVANIRLYINKNDEDQDLTGEEITGDISSVIYLENDKRYRKVAYSSVVLATYQFPEHKEFFTDSRGNKLAEEAWMDKHGCCSVCSGYVDPRQAFRFTQDGQTVCHECAADEGVQMMVSMR